MKKAFKRHKKTVIRDVFLITIGLITQAGGQVPLGLVCMSHSSEWVSATRASVWVPLDRVGISHRSECESAARLSVWAGDITESKRLNAITVNLCDKDIIERFLV